MNHFKAPLLLAVLLLVNTAPAVAEDAEEIRFESMEAESGTTTGPLIGLLIDHETPEQLVADPGFHFDGADVDVVAVHADAMVRLTSTPTEPTYRVIHEGGPATVIGVESRPDLHFWVTPLAGAATVEVQHRACNTVQPPLNDDETRRPALDGANSPIEVDTTGAAQVSSCTDAVAVVTGDFAVVAWEWDVLVNEERINTGVNDTARNQDLTETGIGSADELHIIAHDAQLTIPLTADTYELFIAEPTVEARQLTLHEAEGRIPGIPHLLDGDVDLVGDYHLQIDATTTPFTATVDGTTTDASTNGAPLTVQVPAQPGDGFLSWLTYAALALGLAWVGYYSAKGYRRPLRELAFAQRHNVHAGTCDLETLRERRAAGYYIMGRGAFNANRRKRTHRFARRAVQFNPAHPEARQLLASALSDLGRHQDAYRECQDVYERLGLNVARAQIAFLAARSLLLDRNRDQNLIQHWLAKSIEDDARVFLKRRDATVFDPIRDETWFLAITRRAKLLADDF